MRARVCELPVSFPTHKDYSSITLARNYSGRGNIKAINVKLLNCSIVINLSYDHAFQKTSSCVSQNSQGLIFRWFVFVLSTYAFQCLTKPNLPTRNKIGLPSLHLLVHMRGTLCHVRTFRLMFCIVSMH